MSKYNCQIDNTGSNLFIEGQRAKGNFESELPSVFRIIFIYWTTSLLQDLVLEDKIHSADTNALNKAKKEFEAFASKKNEESLDIFF